MLHLSRCVDVAYHRAVEPGGEPLRLVLERGEPVAPDVVEQRRRLEGRGDPPEKVEARIAHGMNEREAARELGIPVVVNDDLDRAVAEIHGIIESSRLQ